MHNPYTVGAFVTGHNHYGREPLIDRLLNGPGRAYWIVGMLRVGKTSLLRQLEFLTSTSERLVPLYWDMQGADSFGRLGPILSEAVRDHAARFEALGMSAGMMAEEDVLVLLGHLRRAATRAGRELLLLADETEVLVAAARNEPAAMQRFHQQLTSGPGLRAVFAGTRLVYGLHDVCRSWSTSPFLAGFDMSELLGSLELRPALDLIAQEQAPEGVHAPPGVAEAICNATNNHPYLLQMLCTRLFEEQGALRAVTEDDLRVGPQLAGFFAHDWQALTQAERETVMAVQRRGPLREPALQEAAAAEPAVLSLRLRNLEALGFLRRVHGRIGVGNVFLADWLATKAAALAAPPLDTSDAAMRAVFERQDRDTGSLIAQLNARRGRLVELEAVRARELDDAPDDILEEIAQLQTEIAELRAWINRRSRGAARSRTSAAGEPDGGTAVLPKASPLSGAS